MSNDVAQNQEVDWSRETTDLMTNSNFTDTPEITREILTSDAVQQKDMYQETINRVIETLGFAIGNAKKKLDKSFEEKPMPEVGGFTEEGLEQEVEKFVSPTTTDKQTEEALTDAEDTDTASSAIDAATDAVEVQQRTDIPEGGLGSPIREPDFSPIDEAIKEKTSKFYLDIGIHAESDHGDIPKPTNDAREKDKPKPVDKFNPKTSEKSLDIGYGHKITQEEHETGLIHGIKFKEESGYKEGRERFVLLTDEQKRFILETDMEQNLKNARSGSNGWDAKLNKFGGTWDELDYKYKNALTSLAYNVRKPKQWNLVLKAAMDEDVKEFAKQLRRKDAGKITKGMDNRVAKELYYSGIIKNFSDVSDVLTETNAKNVGMPK